MLPTVRTRTAARIEFRPVAEPPAVSVVVASHARQLRLRWLLNALEEQTSTPSAGS